MSNCECWKHRYHVVHTLPGDPRVYDHSQGTMDDLRLRDDCDELESWPAEKYQHGMTADDLRAACQAPAPPTHAPEPAHTHNAREGREEQNHE